MKNILNIAFICYVLAFNNHSSINLKWQRELYLIVQGAQNRNMKCFQPSREGKTPQRVWNNTMISSNREENCYE